MLFTGIEKWFDHVFVLRIKYTTLRTNQVGLIYCIDAIEGKLLKMQMLLYENMKSA